MEQLLVYVGTYTGAKSKGIYRFQLDLATGKASPVELAAETSNPSFLAIRPDHQALYAVSEIADFGGGKSGAVSAFALDPKSGGLSFLNQKSSHGGGPCYVVVDRTGKNVLVANYGGGSVAVLPIQSDGRLGEATAAVQHEGSGSNPQRQEAPHAHSINLDPANQYAFAADLGLDKILVYRFDSGKGTLTANTTPFATVAPGSGPRHFAFHPKGRTAYVINEMSCTVTAFTYDAGEGVLKAVQTLSTLPGGEVKEGYSTAEVQVHPSGKFLYGSNRGHHSIAIFSIDNAGRLTAAAHQPTGGKTPRNFAIDPTGAYLLAANQDSDTIVLFRIDPESGALKPTGEVVQVPMPVCVRFVPVGG